MRSLDTNVLVRYVAGDDEEQARRATAVVAEPCFVSPTVLLETAWVLRSRYGMDRATLAATLRDLLLLPTISVAARDLTAWAVERFAAGADLADMLHLVASWGAEAFITFDRDMARHAGPDAPMPVEEPPT